MSHLMKMLISREIKIVPGLYKIFDEILVNAADNKIRDSNMDHIKVTVDRENGSISIYNNGRGIPIEIHQVSTAPPFPNQYLS
jgi:DNA topoisomerase II